MQRLNALRQHRDAVLALAHQYGVNGLRVFGSVARGMPAQTALLISSSAAWTRAKT
ncbi:MAG: hypothetical protein ACK5O1_02425 [Holosporales bacterium]